MVTNQAYLFFIFIIDGILIGLLFDFFRISRKVIQTSNIATYVEDILFWILTGLYSIFVFNNGELRLFMFLGIILGAFIYMLFISSYFIKINMKIVDILKAIFKTLFIPINFVLKIFRKVFIKPITFLFINVRKSLTNSTTKIHNSIKKPKKNMNIVKN